MPKREIIAGSSVNDASSTSSTPSTDATASPYIKLTPVANIPSRAITTVAPASRIAPGGVHRLVERLLYVVRAPVVLAKARDDEQRVVDPDAESDHQGELRPDVRDRRYVSREPDQPNARDQAKARGDERHAGGDERAEGDQQDYERGQHADFRRRPDIEALRILDHRAARRELYARHVSLGQRDQRAPC